MATILDRYDDILYGISGPEGAKTGQPTNIFVTKKGKRVRASSAIGKYQMLKGTREEAYKKMGYTTPAQLAEAEQRYRTDPAFEHQVAREHVKSIEASVPSSITGEERVKRTFRGWLTGNPNGNINDVGNGNMKTDSYVAGAFKKYRQKSGSTTPTTTTSPSWRSYNEDGRYVAPVQGEPAARTNPTQPWIAPMNPEYTARTPLAKQPMESAPYTLGYTASEKQSSNSQPAMKTRKKLDMADTVPYLSNLYNMSQQPAAVPRPVFDSPTQLQRVSMDNDRYEVNKDYRNLKLNADQNLDANTAAYYKLAGKAGKFQRMSAVNQAERNQNLEIANKETMLNMDVANRNNDKMYQTRALEAERENVMSSQRMGNLANMTDKYMAQQSEQAKNDLEKKRIQFQLDTDPWNVLATLYKKEKLGEKKFGGPMAGKVFRTLKFK